MFFYSTAERILDTKSCFPLQAGLIKNGSECTQRWLRKKCIFTRDIIKNSSGGCTSRRVRRKIDLLFQLCVLMRGRGKRPAGRAPCVCAAGTKRVSRDADINSWEPHGRSERASESGAVDGHKKGC
jgi:hypothetical protein